MRNDEIDCYLDLKYLKIFRYENIILGIDNLTTITNSRIRIRDIYFNKLLLI